MDGEQAPTAKEELAEEPAAEESVEADEEMAAEGADGAAQDSEKEMTAEEALQPTAEEREAVPTRPRNPVATWPFLVYLALWAAQATATALLLTGPDAAAVPLDDPVYPVLLMTGLLLAAFGPVLSGAVWLFALRRRERGERSGLLTAALVRGAAATLFGVVAWWTALLLVDALRLGLV